MKRILGIFAVIILFTISFSAPIVFSGENDSPKEEKEIAADGMEILDIDGEEGETLVEYALPYPGILPDHPLYPIKQLRDNILDFLIRDPVKRVEFNLLMADKRLNMGIFLTDKEKYEAAQKIIIEAEEYFSKALDEYGNAIEQGRDVPSDLLGKLAQSVVKHDETVIILIGKSPEDMKEGYKKILQKIKENQERIEEFGR